MRGLEEGAAIGAGVALTRNLANLPGNVCTPTHLANTAKDLARRHKGLRVKILGETEVRKLKMGSFLSVARGSEEPLKFIVM